MARQSLEHHSTKGSQPSTQQCMISTDMVMWGVAQCEGVEKKENSANSKGVLHTAAGGQVMGVAAAFLQISRRM